MSKMLNFQVFLVCAAFVAGAKAQLPQVAVVELPAQMESDAQHTIELNIENVKKQLEDLKGKDDSIKLLVFPEYGLTGLNPDVEASAQFIPGVDVPVQQYQNNVKRLSDIALSYKVALVVNLLEFVNTTTTKTYYNSLIVFDENGRLIKKTHKINLRSEEREKLSAGSEIGILEIYGNKFGLLIGEDLLTVEAFKLSAISGVIVSASWKNTLPTNLATSVAYGFERRTATPVYFSNLNKPDEGISGSGVYTSNLVDAKTTGKSSTFVKKGSMKSGRGLPGEDDNAGLRIENESIKNLVKTAALSNAELYEEHHCKLTTGSDLSSAYQLVSYKSKEKIGGRDYVSYFCGLIPNDENNIRIKTNVDLANVTIEVDIDRNSDNKTIVLPVAADFNLVPPQFVYSDNNFVSVSIQDAKDVIVFGIRILKSASFRNEFSLAVLIVCGLVKVLFG